MTDAEGKFAFHGLDPELLFELLVVAPGYAPRSTERDVDPLLGELGVEIEPRDLAAFPPEQVLRGRVVDAQGDPIQRAALMPVAQRLDPRRTRYGMVDADPLAVSDANGRFELGVDEPRMELLLQVSAPAYAPRMSPWLAAGAEDNAVTLTRGATVTGRVEREGKPVAGLLLGLAQQNRSGDHFLGERLIETDERGRFTFVNVAPNDVYALYGKASGCASHGALPVRLVQVGADETTLDAGSIALEPGVRLSGRIVIADGGAVPEGTKLILDRDEAFDALVATVTEEGRFEFACVPREVFTLAPRLRTHHVSPRNASYDFLNQGGLIGRVDADTELVVLLEQGEAPDPTLDGDAFERYEALKRAPLRGLLEVPGKR